MTSDPEFLLLSPFFFEEASFKAVLIHEIAISEIEDRQFLVNKFQGALSEIRYRIHTGLVWDAGLEMGRTEVVDGIVFPERNVMDLDILTSFLEELQETSLDQVSNTFFSKDTTEKSEKLTLVGVHPEIVVKVFSNVLNRSDEEHLIRNFVAATFRFNFRKYSFTHEITDDILKLKNKADTFRICQTLLLLIALGIVEYENASYINRVLIQSLRRKNKNRRVLLSDDLRKLISEWIEMSPTDLSKAIGFSSKDDFIHSLNSIN